MDYDEIEIDNWIKGIEKSILKGKLTEKEISEVDEVLFKYGKGIKYEIGTEFYRARIFNNYDIETKNRIINKELFEGYDKENSFVNLANMADGRANNNNTKCLYVSLDLETCIPEVRPYAGSFVSVAKIKNNAELNIYNLSDNISVSTTDINDNTLPNIANKSLIISRIKDEFNKPVKSKEDYLSTQFFTARLIEAGYDGVQYASAYSLNIDLNERYNLAIFNYDKCEAISSKLYRVTNVITKYKKCEDLV